MKLANPESAATYFRVTRRSRLFVRTGSIAIASFLTACFFPAVADQHERSQDPAPIKRALLVGIGSYAPGTNWGDLASLGDLEIMQDALLQQEFAAENIKTVTSPNATRRDIVDAFKTHLIGKAGKGDILVFHYSGHGHRIPDQNRDEIDGYDEVLVPYDAPHFPAADYDGSLHFRDDELGSLLTMARDAVGETGEVVAFIDSCFSGTISRAVEISAIGSPRGDKTPFGDPQPKLDGSAHGQEQTIGIFEGPLGEPTPSRGALIVYSAARHDTLAYQIKEGDQEIGSLTYALRESLGKAGHDKTYKALLSDLQESVRGTVLNVPQAEGHLNTRIFGGGGVRQTKPHQVARIDTRSRMPVLEGGPLVGLVPSARVAFFPSGTLTPQSKTPIAMGTVLEDESSTESKVQLDQPVDDATLAQIRSNWAFVTLYPPGSLRPASIYVPQSLTSAQWLDDLRGEVEAEPLAAFADVGGADLMLERFDTNRVAIVAKDGRRLMGPLNPLSAGFSKDIAKRLRDYAFNSWLRRWDYDDEDYKIEVQVVPCEMKRIANNELLCRRFRDTPAQSGSQWKFEDGYGLIFRNIGNKRTSFAVLDLLPDGRIGQLWPAGNARPEDSKLDPGEAFQPPFSYTIGKEPGHEVLLVVASKYEVNFDVLRSEGARGIDDLGQVSTQKFSIHVIGGQT